MTSTCLVEILGPAQESGDLLPLADKLEVVLQLTDVVLEILATDAEVCILPVYPSIFQTKLPKDDS